jgi:hypothetical protein
VLKAPADESPIDIAGVIRFLDSYHEQPADIRQSVDYLSWKTQMQRVLDELKIDN